MGGIGSTRWEAHTRRHTVSECLTFDLPTLRREQVLPKGALNRNVVYQKIVRWWNNDKQLANIQVFIDTTEALTVPHIRLCYQSGVGQLIDELFEISYQPTRFGGERAWLRCVCGKRARSLHNPPNSQFFRCRHCHDLSYKSCQESHCYGVIGEAMKAIQHTEKTLELLRQCHHGSKRQKSLQKRFQRHYEKVQMLDKLRLQLTSPEQFFQRLDHLSGER